MSFNFKLSALWLYLFISPALAVNIYSKDGVDFDIFGRVQAVGANSHAARELNAAQSANGKGTIQSSARFGLAGRAKLNDTFSGIGVAELEYRSNSELSRLRYAYAGVDGKQYGILTFGRGDSAYYTVAGVTDIYNCLDSRANDYYLLGEQRSGQIMYTLSSLGWDLRASYNFAVDGLNNIFKIKRGFAVALSTQLANTLSLSYGYALYDFSYDREDLSSSLQSAHPQYRFFRQTLSKMHGTEDEQFLQEARPRRREDFGAALSYGAFGDGLYLALVYNASKYDGYSHHVVTYEAVANYAMQCGLSFTVGYGQQRFGSRILISDLNLGLTYKPSPNFKVFAEAQLDMGASPEKLYGQDYIERFALAENKYVLGAELDF